jgi:hypothetical protein
MREKEREREAIHLTLAVATGGLGVERSVAVQDALHGRRLAARGRAATTKLHPPPRTIHTPHASYSVSVMCCCGLRLTSLPPDGWKAGRERSYIWSSCVPHGAVMAVRRVCEWVRVIECVYAASSSPHTPHLVSSLPLQVLNAIRWRREGHRTRALRGPCPNPAVASCMPEGTRVLTLCHPLHHAAKVNTAL